MTWLARVGVFLVLLTAGWGGGRAIGRRHVQTWSPGHARIHVLTTIFPIYDFTREVGAPYVEVRNLLPPGVDPHEFALSPHDIALVAGADVILANGSGLDDFIMEAIRKAGVTSKEVIRLSDGLPKLQSAGRDAHSHGETGDPHLWLDPVDARVYVRRIGRELAKAEAGHGAGEATAWRIHLQQADYLLRLAILDEDYSADLMPLRGRSFIAFHSAYQYLANRYGLRVAAVWQESPGREPSPKEVGRIMELAKAEHVRALFAEPQFSPRAIEMIAADARLPVYTLNPVETAPDFATAHYTDIMRENLATLVKALGR